ncbi:Hsp70 family protein [Corynebacterium variabile]|uniref:Hsp70 family protein n=1 Tax=Corynebacterium variabile TaxID=1727 RepID=UPI003A8D8F46
MSRIIGIDLGTTYSAVASIGPHGRAEIIPDRDGMRTTPSAVLFQDDGSALIGTVAKRSAASAPLNYIDAVKRQMGNADWKFITEAGISYTPEEISALILKRLKEDAEEYLGEPVVDAIITVPAYFDDSQRHATKDAGRIAGLNVLHVLNEPTAAALAYGESQHRDGTFLVYDLGGGTFDVTIVRILGNHYDIVATDGIHELGGRDWDDRLFDHLNDAFQEGGGPDLSEDFVTATELREKAETAKKTLSQTKSTRVVLSGRGVTETVTVSREELEELTETLVNRTRYTVEGLLKDAGLTWEAIDDVILVGGSTRIPRVRAMLEEMSGRPPRTGGNPDEMVALGAAVRTQTFVASEGHAGTDVGVEGTTADHSPAIVIEDVSSQGLGVVASDENSIIIPRNTKVPVKESGFYSTSVDQQQSIAIQVTQGDDEDLDYVKILGVQEYVIPPYPADAPLRIDFAYDIDQMITIEVVDLTTGLTLGSFAIETVANMKPEDIDNAINRNKSTEVY